MREQIDARLAAAQAAYAEGLAKISGERRAAVAAALEAEPDRSAYSIGLAMGRIGDQTVKAIIAGIERSSAATVAVDPLVAQQAIGSVTPPDAD